MAAQQRLERIGICLVIVVYAVAAIVLLRDTLETCAQMGTFSNDSAGICDRAYDLVAAPSSIDYYKAVNPGGDGPRCDPYPYGELYNDVIALPLILLKGVTPVSQATLIRWATVVLAISGMATLLLTYRIGSRLYGPGCALLATLLVLGTPEFWRWSHELHPDMPQLALLMAGFYFAVRLYERSATDGRRWILDLSLASFFAGAAMAAKFHGVLLFPVIALACNGRYLSGAERFAWRDAARRNIGGGVLCVAVFAATWALFSPCFAFHRSLFVEPFLRARRITTGEVFMPLEVDERISNFLHSNSTLANDVVGPAGYVVILVSLLIGAAGLLLHRSAELKRPRLLADVFVMTVLVYSLGLGQGLHSGVLLKGYGRYLLPGVPLAYVAAMRAVQAVGSRWPQRRWVPIAFSMLLLLGQSAHIRRAVSQYDAFYVRKETGSFRVHDWILENVPRGSRIHTERYIFVPREGYEVTESALIDQIRYVETSNYIVTKTLEYDVFSDPDRWHLYSGGDAPLRARYLHQILEWGRPRGIVRVAELSARDARGNDTAFVYKNLNAPQRSAAGDAGVVPKRLETGNTVLIAVGGLAFFVDQDSEHGIELWRSDGTPGGTRLVADLIPGAAGSSPRFLTAGRTVLYFIADRKADQAWLWRSDGTAENTQPIMAVQASAGRSFVPDMKVSGDELSFVSVGKWVEGRAFGSAIEIWRSDGTPGGTVAMPRVHRLDLHTPWYPTAATVVGHTFYFITDNRKFGRELWHSAPGDKEPKMDDLIPGRDGAFDYDRLVAPEPTAFGDQLLFVMDDRRSGMELWRHNASGATIVKDIASGAAWSSPTNLTRLGERIYFVADDGRSGREPWMTDGTEAGTMQLRDIRPGRGGSLEFDNLRSPQFTDVGGRTFFVADDGESGLELWMTDGTTNGTSLVKDIRAGAGSAMPTFLSRAGKSLFFLADDGNGKAIWRTDASGIAAVPAYRLTIAGGASIESLTATDKRIFFVCDCDGSGRALWSIDVSAPELAPARLASLRGGGPGLDSSPNGEN
jgi:ELWxxDGT repeat protein